MSPYKMGVVNTPTEQNYPGYSSNHGWGMAKGGGNKGMKYGGSKKMSHGGSMKGRRHNSMTGGYR
jgi:hypothetical protein